MENICHVKQPWIYRLMKTVVTHKRKHTHTNSYKNGHSLICGPTHFNSFVLFSITFVRAHTITPISKYIWDIAHFGFCAIFECSTCTYPSSACIELISVQYLHLLLHIEIVFISIRNFGNHANSSECLFIIQLE